MTVTAKQFNAYTSGTDYGIASNSLAVAVGDFVSKTGGYVVLATAGSYIVGTSVEAGTYASDNQTVAKEKVIYRPQKDTEATYTVTISGGTVTQDDEGKFYDLSDENTVDGTTESTTTGQLILKRFISATLGEFAIVNA